MNATTAIDSSPRYFFSTILTDHTPPPSSPARLASSRKTTITITPKPTTPDDKVTKRTQSFISSMQSRETKTTSILRTTIMPSNDKISNYSTNTPTARTTVLPNPTTLSTLNKDKPTTRSTQERKMSTVEKDSTPVTSAIHTVTAAMHSKSRTTKNNHTQSKESTPLSPTMEKTTTKAVESTTFSSSTEKTTTKKITTNTKSIKTTKPQKTVPKTRTPCFVYYQYSSTQRHHDDDKVGLHSCDNTYYIL